MAEVLEELATYARGEKAFTLRLRDPMANTWIYSPFEDGIGAGGGAGGGGGVAGVDPSLTVTSYRRTDEEDADLGLADMNAPEDVDGSVAAAAAAGGAS